MENRINELIYNIVKINNYSEVDTQEFKKIKHNDDLVPRFQKNLETLQRLISNYYDDCYDIQGITDNGVDILLKYKNDFEVHKIGFQIKSYDDIKNKEWLSKLKAQLFEEQQIWKTEDFYIVFCTDSKEHKDKLRNAIAEIQKYSGCKIHIIKPEEALSFYNFNYIEILSCVYQFFHKSDSFLEKVKNSISSYSKRDLFTLIEVIVYQFFNNEDNISIDELSNPSEDICDPFSSCDLISYDFDSEKLKYIYSNNWLLTNYVSEIKANFNLDDSEYITFLNNQLNN